MHPRLARTAGMQVVCCRKGWVTKCRIWPRVPGLRSCPPIPTTLPGPSRPGRPQGGAAQGGARASGGAHQCKQAQSCHFCVGHFAVVRSISFDEAVRERLQPQRGACLHGRPWQGGGQRGGGSAAARQQLSGAARMLISQQHCHRLCPFVSACLSCGCMWRPIGGSTQCGLGHPGAQLHAIEPCLLHVGIPSSDRCSGRHQAAVLGNSGSRARPTLPAGSQLPCRASHGEAVMKNGMAQDRRALHLLRSVLPALWTAAGMTCQGAWPQRLACRCKQASCSEQT